MNFKKVCEILKVRVNFKIFHKFTKILMNLKNKKPKRPCRAKHCRGLGQAFRHPGASDQRFLLGFRGAGLVLRRRGTASAAANSLFSLPMPLMTPS